MRTISILALLILLLSFIGTAARVDEPEDPEEERGGWTVAGRRFSFAPDGAAPRPGGRLENYCSARIVYDLLTVSDTLWIGTEGGLFAYCISRDSVEAAPAPIDSVIQPFDPGGEPQTLR